MVVVQLIFNIYLFKELKNIKDRDILSINNSLSKTTKLIKYLMDKVKFNSSGNNPKNDINLN